MTLDPTSLRRLFRRRLPAAHAAIDAADMGTCFGLEMSFADTVPLVAPAADPQPAAPVAWWRRRPAADAKPC